GHVDQREGAAVAGVLDGRFHLEALQRTEADRPALGDASPGAPGADLPVGAQHAGLAPLRVVEINLFPPLAGGFRRLPRAVADDALLPLAGQRVSQADDQPGGATLVRRLDRDDVLPGHQRLANLVAFEARPLAALPDLRAVDEDDEAVVGGDLQG